MIASIKSLPSHRWFWAGLAFVLAFLIYHAPRIAVSLPLI